VAEQWPVKAEHLTAELTTLRGEIAPGSTLQAGLVLTLDKGWHVYWINAGDSGQPPKIRWTLEKQHFKLLKADWTQYDPKITADLASVNRSGVPTYVIYPAGSDSSAHVLPELLTRDIVSKAIDKRRTRWDRSRFEIASQNDACRKAYAALADAICETGKGSSCSEKACSTPAFFPAAKISL
jgi:hypothetical protein